VSFREWRMCGRKRLFYSPREARRCRPKMKVYQCPYCNGFHLTKQIDPWEKHVLLQKLVA
jgi:hypothetical protein